MLVLARGGDGALVCHRVLGRVDSETVLLAGDRSGAPHPGSPEGLLGVVRVVHRGGLALRLDGRCGGLVDGIVAALRRLALASRRRSGWLWQALARCGSGAALLLARLRARGWVAEESVMRRDEERSGAS
jgi:hypothetical protein